jgi:branched-subunit amino acid transport protein
MIPALIVLAVGTFVMKGVGPVAAAGRELPPRVARLTTLLPAALLAALVATQTVAGPDGLTVDARLVGVGAAGVTVMLKAPFGIVVLVGAAVTALIRFFGWG